MVDPTTISHQRHWFTVEASRVSKASMIVGGTSTPATWFTWIPTTRIKPSVAQGPRVARWKGRPWQGRSCYDCWRKSWERSSVKPGASCWLEIVLLLKLLSGQLKGHLEYALMTKMMGNEDISRFRWSSFLFSTRRNNKQLQGFLPNIHWVCFPLEAFRNRFLGCHDVVPAVALGGTRARVLTAHGGLPMQHSWRAFRLGG